MNNPLMKQMGGQLKNLLARGVVSVADGARKLRTIQARLMAGEVKDGLEHFEAFGLTSEPLPGAELLAAFFNGDRSSGVVFLVADRRYRPRDLKPGEVVVYDIKGQKIYLSENGIVIDGAGLPVTVENTPTVTIKADSAVRIESPNTSATGDITSRSDDQPLSLNQLRAIFNSHTHNENLVMGGPTSAPNQGV